MERERTDASGKARHASDGSGRHPQPFGLADFAARWLLFGLALAGLLAAVFYLRGGDSGSPPEAGSLGEQVQPFELPDIVSGRQVSLAGYLGKQEIVIVSYMGWF